MLGLANSTGLILEKSNVTCNTVYPSLIYTKLLDNKYILNALILDNSTIKVFNGRDKKR